ncbi:N-acyl homoserine lactonase family protein [Streptomyces sp. NPDC048277]|uniref:N-acyl homoserine lactonase family protein n=1 Tax=Streptomyces sp. NPDC048277 TaxID=3155027 RepID=UPI0033E1F037
MTDTSTPAHWEVYAVRFGRHRLPRSAFYLNYAGYGEPDGDLTMDYYLWLVRGPAGTIVVDTGFAPEAGRRRGREVLADPVAVLAELGVDASTVPTVVVTHAHYDHIGNLHRFPAAEVVMSRREYAFWQGPFAGRAHFAIPTEPAELALLPELFEEGRLTLVGAQHRLAPGVELLEVGGHTPGQLIVVVRGAAGTAVLASDAIHSYEEYERDRPFAIVADVAGMYRAYDRIRELERQPGTSVVAGHDPEVMTRFTPHLPGTVCRVL